LFWIPRSSVLTQLCCFLSKFSICLNILPTFLESDMINEFSLRHSRTAYNHNSSEISGSLSFTVASEIYFVFIPSSFSSKNQLLTQFHSCSLERRWHKTRFCHDLSFSHEQSNKITIFFVRTNSI
jgi:hypothetical protein